MFRIVVEIFGDDEVEAGEEEVRILRLKVQVPQVDDANNSRRGFFKRASVGRD